MFFAPALLEALAPDSTPEAAESEILAILTRVAYRVARPFGYLTIDDAAQECLLFGLRVLQSGKYDPSRPLIPFIKIHMRNRLANLKRDIFMRPEAPCSCCEPFDPPASPCDRWLSWNAINQSKRSLSSGASSSLDEPNSNAHDESDLALISEIEGFVDETFSPDLRADYFRMKAGTALPKHRKEKVRQTILARFGEAYYDA